MPVTNPTDVRFHRRLGFSAGTSSESPTFEVTRAGAGRFDSTLTCNGLINDTAFSRFDDTVAITDGTSGQSEPSGMTQGLYIHQGAADDSIIMGASTDVAHGFTTLAPTDVYLEVRKAVAADGGVRITALSDGTTTNTLLIRAIQTAAMDTTRTTSGRGAIELYGTLGSGTDVANATADANIVAVRTRAAGADVTRFMLDTDGDSHQDVGTAWTNFDTQDDLVLLNTLASNVARPENVIGDEFKDWLSINKTDLEDLKLVSFNDDGHHFVNMSKLAMLNTGAIRQLGLKLKRIETALLKAGLDPALLTA